MSKEPVFLPENSIKPEAPTSPPSLLQTKSIFFKEKALLVIEMLCAEESLTLTKFTKDGELIPNKAREFLDKIYRIAHAATEHECKHIEWEKEVEDTYKFLDELTIL